MSSNASMPFTIREVSRAEGAAAELFSRAFNAPPPTYPRHFVAILNRDGEEQVAAYIHYSEIEVGVFLCGGLCVDARVYRRLSPGERATLSECGSLARWLIDASIGELGSKRAVFAYTGDSRSRRDAFALGFVSTQNRFLLVQWHTEPLSSRDALVDTVTTLGAF